MDKQNARVAGMCRLAAAHPTHAARTGEHADRLRDTVVSSGARRGRVAS